MVYPDSIDNLTDRPNASEVRSQDPNDAYQALRDIRDGLGDTLPMPAARVERSTDQTVSSGTFTKVTWEQADFDNTSGNMWDSSSPTALTLPEAGIYLLTAGTIWQDSSGRRVTTIHVGGTKMADSVTHPTNNGQTTVSTLVHVASSTNADLRVLQESGADLALLGIPRTFFAAQKVAVL